MNARIALPALCVVIVVIAASLWIVQSNDTHPPTTLVESSSEPSGLAEGPSSGDSVVTSSGEGHSRRQEVVVPNDVVASVSRPPAFVGSVKPEDFLREWWGADWPTVQAWLQEHGREIPSGPWEMDGQLLPEEAEARVRDVLLRNVQKTSNDSEELAAAQRLEEKCVLPTDRVTRSDDGLVQAPRVGGGEVSLTEAQFEGIQAALAPRRDVLRSAYKAIMDEEIRIGVEQVNAGGFYMTPFVDYFPDNCLTVGPGQSMVSDTSGIWRTRMVVDYQNSAYYNALVATYNSAKQDTLKIYDQLLASY